MCMFCFSCPTMETQTKTQRPNNGQLISVPHKDTVRLLEVYVKRSLSVNDGTLGVKRAEMKEKWVTMPKKHRRHSSDPSLHLAGELHNKDIVTFSAVKPTPNQPEKRHEEPDKPTKKTKKNKKPTFWKSLFGIFSRKSNEEKDEEQDSPSEIPKVSQEKQDSDTATICLLMTPVLSQKRMSMRKKSIKRRFSKRRLSLTKPHKPGKELNPADITRVEGTFEDDLKSKPYLVDKQYDSMLICLFDVTRISGYLGRITAVKIILLHAFSAEVPVFK